MNPARVARLSLCLLCERCCTTARCTAAAFSPQHADAEGLRAVPGFPGDCLWTRELLPVLVFSRSLTRSRQMGRNTAADLESLLQEFSEEAEPETRGGRWGGDEEGGSLDYAQLERFLDDDEQVS
jgi:hypothetical protein